ncbi:expressed unknown protein [Seminavis robusta]|uniref:Uncharacterized protein n=1 Tax=Seminavis robusta TaxID=568900 RepID=A0A9N8EQH5_9STRA|nr:expressed unknown protein [Seminavis robusta]|eukprot:Sro1606_g285460.1 n/a (280) ;mRNA; f:1320-2159
MTLRNLFRQASAKALSSMKKKKSRRSSKEKKAQEQQKPTSHTCFDEDLSQTHVESEVEQTDSCCPTTTSSEVFAKACSFFGEELQIVRDNERITKVTLQDFIERYEREDLLALTDIVRTSTRRWKTLKFVETIDGTNYRRWQFRKDNLRRALEQAIQESPQEENKKFPIAFQEHLKIDMDEMTREGIVNVLKEVQKNRYVTSISIEGFLTYQNVESVVGPLVRLLTKGDRRWKDVVLRVSFDGDATLDYPQWDMKVTMAKVRLEEVSHNLRVPIGFHIC